MKISKARKKTVFSILIILGILITAAVFRFYNINWDNNHHLHPDERFIVMTEMAIKLPSSLKEYLDPVTSPFSPYNTPNKAYVYGTFPLFWTKIWGEWTNNADYNQITLVGRFWSALFNTATVLMTYFIGKKLWGRKVGYISAALMALNPFLIQQSHFFTVDTFALFFIVLNFNFLIEFYRTRKRKKSYILLVAIAVSMALAVTCKISAALYASIVLAGFVFKYLSRIKKKRAIKVTFEYFFQGILILLISYTTFRFVQPYFFATNNWLDFTPQPDFWASFTFFSDVIRNEVLYPPQFQWLTTLNYWHPFKNLFFWGIMPHVMIVSLLGMIMFIYDLILGVVKKFKLSNFKKLLDIKLLIIAWIIGIFFYRAGLFTKMMRYFISIYPFIILFGGGLLIRFERIGKKIFLAVVSVTIALSFIFSLAFMSIYQKDVSRISASKWVYDNIDQGAGIGYEHWDDPIPLHLEDKTPSGYDYKWIEFQVYNPDDEKKIDHLFERISQADYLILSSFRAKNSIGVLPERFPYMYEYYQALESGELGFEKVQTFTSYPAIMDMEINDDSSEESFWVYDHPKVEIFKKVNQIQEEELSSILTR